MVGLLKLIPLAYKLIPDADKAQEIAGQIHLAAIDRIHEYVYSALAAVFGISLVVQLYQVDGGQPLNWTTFGVRLALLGVLLGVKAKEVREYWKLAQQIKKDSTIGRDTPNR